MTFAYLYDIYNHTECMDTTAENDRDGAKRTHNKYVRIVYMYYYCTRRNKSENSPMVYIGDGLILPNKMWIDFRLFFLLANII